MRSRVTQIAAQLFRAEGIAGLSMRRIAREAGVSVMSLYDYFRSKNEVVHSIWECLFAKCFERVDRAATASGLAPRARLEAACAAYTRYWLDNPDEYRVVFMIEDRIEQQEKYYIETSSVLTRYRIFAQLLAAHLGVADVASERLRERAVALVCCMNGICHMLVTVSEHSWPPAARLLEQVLRMVDGPLQ